MKAKSLLLLPSTGFKCVLLILTFSYTGSPGGNIKVPKHIQGNYLREKKEKKKTLFILWLSAKLSKAFLIAPPLWIFGSITIYSGLTRIQGSSL